MSLISLVLGVCAFGVNNAQAAPKASAIAKTWELDFTFHDVQRISLTHAGDSQPTTYWYLLFTVTNDTGRDVEFFPSFRLVTESFQVREGGENISPSVYEAIFDRHRGDYRFTAEPSEITGTLLQGEDNARTSAAVFRMFDAEANRFNIFVSGLSGDLARVRNPGFDDSKTASDDNAPFFILRRTLAITYDLPGDAISRPNARPIRRQREWVMR